MKRVLSLSAAPPRLARYVAGLNRPVQQGDYKRFRDPRRERYRELQAALIEVQHGLCAYCEQRIGPDPERPHQVQIEHFIPKSEAPHRELDYTNLLGCCLGIPGADSEEPERDPAKTHGRETLTCGQAKGGSSPDATPSLVLDPRRFPLTPSGTLPNLVRVSKKTGEITAHEDGCAEVGVAPEQLNQTLRTLNLNSETLRLRRRQVWAELARSVDPEATTPDYVKAQIMPGDDKALLMFWSTVRCFFGGLAEDVLAQDEAKAALCEG